jgi:hypothetical protein
VPSLIAAEVASTVCVPSSLRYSSPAATLIGAANAARAQIARDVGGGDMLLQHQIGHRIADDVIVMASCTVPGPMMLRGTQPASSPESVERQTICPLAGFTTASVEA